MGHGQCVITRRDERLLSARKVMAGALQTYRNHNTLTLKGIGDYSRAADGYTYRRGDFTRSAHVFACSAISSESSGSVYSTAIASMKNLE